jgi:hypothetical protein
MLQAAIFMWTLSVFRLRILRTLGNATNNAADL